ncbi:hypothetical protein AL485_18255 [Serratia liquefaciens]|uniref:hypothetical protein n=1 Tax=Serratia liquefaciens TaxID=614 RepID=UPI00076B6978|nr:hypothetical protein [Serratia liquefaciens]AMH00948.1 hypothetical protein AL485_18255 [Serratia liquefaciens]
MRRYRLDIFDKNGNIPKSQDGTPIGPFDTNDSPGRGLHIEFDALITGYDVVNSGTVITIFGLPISMISQSVNLVGGRVILQAGFASGLPLANDTQYGPIIMGEIYNAYGNWVGTNQALSLVINPAPLPNTEAEKGITLVGREGDKLGDVLGNALKKAYPKFNVDVSISDEIVLSESPAAVYENLEELATVARSMSQAVIKDEGYLGIQISAQCSGIRVFDNYKVESAPIKGILSHELIGQPTWVDYQTVSFKCPLRKDLRNGDVVDLPINIVSGPASILSVNSPQSLSSQRNDVTFSGRFLISSVRHVGQYLTADGSNAWVTIIEAYGLNPKAK